MYVILPKSIVNLSQFGEIEVVLVDNAHKVVAYTPDRSRSITLYEGKGRYDAQDIYMDIMEGIVEGRRYIRISET